MIGIVGPADSVELALQVAKEVSLREKVAGRVYQHVDETVGLARELEPVSRVLLFTGRIPYAVARQEEGWRSTLDFIPHAGTDLYRALVRILRERRGSLPEVSIDTIEPDDAAASFRDLDLPAPRHVLPLEVVMGRGPGGLDAIVAFHRDRYTAGEVDLCLSCVGAVYERLSAEGVPAHRVEHTRSSVRDALERAALVSMLARSESTQTAIGLIEVPALEEAGSRADGFYEARRTRLRVQESLLDYAEGLRGTLSTLDERTFIVHTTRGAIEDAIDRHARGHNSPLEPRDLPSGSAAGFGLGFAVSSAESSARRALAAARGTGDVNVLFADGRHYRMGDGRPKPQRGLRVAAANDDLGLGPLAFGRLLAALRRLDDHELTAQQLADAYGVQARSARRLLAQLQDAGVASEGSQQPSGGRGRPAKRYRIDLDLLARLASQPDVRTGRRGQETT